MRVPFPGWPWCRYSTLLIAVSLYGMLLGDPAYGYDWPAGDPPRSRQPPARRHYAEIEVALNDSLTLDDLKQMPHAPGSRPQLLEAGRRVRVQLPAPLVGDLIEQGQDVTVLADFMLSEKSKGPGYVRRSASAMAAAEGPGDPFEGSNETDYPIPDLDWVRSDIVIEEAPANAVVTLVDVHFEIVHPLIGDLWIDLQDAGQTHEYTLWFLEGGFGADISETVTGIGEFAGERVNQTWGLRATDVAPTYDGYIDYWWIKIYFEERDIVLPHDEQSQPAPIDNGVPYQGTTAGASGQYETRCGFQDRLDVWHVYTPAQTGMVSVRLESNEFDTTLAVFDPCGAEQACSDDGCDGTNSEIAMPMAAGVPYLIRVAGYDDASGDYVLTVDQQALARPSAPDHPRPIDGAGIRSVPVVLSWNGDAEANALEMDPLTSRSGKANVAQPKAIYGRDDRQEEYEVADPRVLAAGRATAMLLYRQDLVDNGDGTYQLPNRSFAWWYEWLNPIDTGNTLCADEPFGDQPSIGTCTGVLVGPDLLATAGHCVACLNGSDIAVVFDFVMQDANTPTLVLHRDQVYWIEEVVECQAGSPDWGLVRLDRAVSGRAPLSLRRTGQVADAQPVFVVGHPWGVPRKYDGGGIVRENAETTFFQANLDTYRGSSGSPVINLDSMVVEGLLVRGMPEFVEDPLLGCDRSSVCPDTGCSDGGVSQWEDVTRATTFSAAVPSFDVYLGLDPNRLDLVGVDLVVPRFAPAPLRKDAVYYWRVVARNAYGQVEGPLWTFYTALTPAGSATSESGLPVFPRP